MTTPWTSLLTSDIGERYSYRWMAKTTELLPGTLDLLILRTLELRPLHGVGIADRIEQVTRGVFVVGPGSLSPLYTGLQRKAGSKAAGKWKTAVALRNMHSLDPDSLSWPKKSVTG